MTSAMKTLTALCCLIALTLPACTQRGFTPMPFAPESQQQAQDTVVDHLRRTLAGLPPGTILDASRFAGAGHNSYCDDDDSGASAPMRFHTIGELKIPDSGGDEVGVVTAVGELWRGWGWQVLERDGFRTPNRFGYSPDGYRLQIITAAADGYPPTVQASSPCFPRQIARDDIPIPDVLEASR